MEDEREVGRFIAKESTYRRTVYARVIRNDRVFVAIKRDYR